MFDFFRAVSSLPAKLAILQTLVTDWRGAQTGTLQAIKLELADVHTQVRSLATLVQGMNARLGDVEMAVHETVALAATPHDPTDRPRHPYVDPDKQGDDPTPEPYREDEDNVVPPIGDPSTGDPYRPL